MGGFSSLSSSSNSDGSTLCSPVGFHRKATSLRTRYQDERGRAGVKSAKETFKSSLKQVETYFKPEEPGDINNTRSNISETKIVDTPKILVVAPKRATTKVRNNEDHSITSECSKGHIIVFTWAKLIQFYK